MQQHHEPVLESRGSGFRITSPEKLIADGLTIVDAAHQPNLTSLGNRIDDSRHIQKFGLKYARGQSGRRFCKKSTPVRELAHLTWFSAGK